MGNKLFKQGFTWFKDWYFPEGGSEGTQKLQGEKPLDEDARTRQTEALVVEIKDFVEKMRYQEEKWDEGSKVYLRNALKRAEEILSK